MQPINCVAKLCWTGTFLYLYIHTCEVHVNPEQLSITLCAEHASVGISAGTAPPPPIKGGSGNLLSSPSKRGFFFGGTLVKANSDPIPDSPSANSESPLLNSRFSLSRVSEDRAMLSREATASGALPDIEKPEDRVIIWHML